MILHIGLLFALFLTIETAHATVVDRVVAIVNQEVITLSELKLANAQFENPLFRELSLEPSTLPKAPQLQETLRILIEKKLQLQAARKRGVIVGQEELQHVLGEIKTRQGITNDTTFQRLLAKENVTLSDYTQELKDQLTILKLINREIHSSVVLQEEEINAYYRAHPEQFRLAEQIRLAQVLLPLPKNPKGHEVQKLEEQAKKIQDELLNGADFGSIAQKYSDGSEAHQGGDLGYFRKGELMEEIERAVFSLQVSEITPVVRTPLGFHIFKLLEKKTTEIVPYEEVKNRVGERLLSERTDMAYKRWLRRLRDQAYVEVKM
ncbi:MAG: peptidylprolyl isomerase [Nitrospira sp.]|nr:peptidylprolyl isomerase [Nitrospira sp.]